MAIPCKRTPGVLRVLILLLAPLLASVACPGWAEDQDGEDSSILLDDETLTCPAPALRLTRPNDSWRFVDLERARAQAVARGEDTSGYRNLRFRLWYGAARANIYAYAWVDEERRDEPLRAEDLAVPMLEELRPHFDGMRAQRPVRVRVGQRTGVLLEVSGKHQRLGEHALLRAVVVRPEDGAIVTIALECRPERLPELRRDLRELLRRARL